MNSFKKYRLTKKIKVIPSKLHVYEEYITQEINRLYTDTIVSKKVGYIKKVLDIIDIVFYDIDKYDGKGSIIFNVIFHANCFNPKIGKIISFKPSIVTSTFFMSDTDKYQMALPFTFLDNKTIKKLKTQGTFDVKITVYEINWNIKKIQIVLDVV